MPSPRQGVSCESCMYFEEGEPRDGEIQDGECRFHAPQPFGAVPAGADLSALWPIVSVTDWCGKWRRALDIPGPATEVTLIPGEITPA